MTTADEVRRLYVHYRRMVHGKYTPADRWRGTWKKIAVFLDKHDVPLDRYMEAQFASVHPFPMPNMLVGDKALARYYSYVKGASDEYSRRLLYEANFIKSHSHLPLKHLLSAEPSTLSPVFRYCLARKHGYDDLADELTERALLQLRRSSECRRFYRPYLPVDMLEQIDE